MNDNHISVEAKIIYVDPLGELHPARVTHIWGDADDNPTINLETNDTQEVVSSVVHRSRTEAPGRYWNQW